MNAAVFRDFLSSIASELARRGGASTRLPAREQLPLRAGSVAEVPAAEAGVEQLLQQRGLQRRCDGQGPGSFCLRLPERNNFQSALQEQNKVGSGGGFFVGLLLILVTAGAAGLQVQTVVSRWRDYGILQALGFTPAQVLTYYGLQLALVLAGGVAIAAVTSLLLTTISTASLILAAGLTALAAGLASLLVLVWPLQRLPAELLRDAA